MIGQRTLDEGKNWFLPQLATVPIEIAVVGQFDVDAVIKAVAATFGALPTRASGDPYAEQRKVKFPPKKFSDTVTFNGLKTVSDLRYVWPTPEIASTSDYRRAEILAAILEDRLRLKLRAALGATYSPSASFTFCNYLNPAPAFFMCEVETDPEKTELVATTTRQVAAKLAREGATQEEFDRALQPMIRQNETDLRDNTWWLSTLADAQTHLESAESLATKASCYQAIILREINAMAAKCLLADRRSLLIAMPVLDATYYAEKGESKLSQGDYAGSIAEYDQAIKREPNKAEHYTMRGFAKEMLDDNAGALADYSQAIALDPGFQLAYTYRGRLHLGQDNNAAILDFNKAIELKPDDTDSYNTRGICKNALGDHAGAIADYDQAIKLAPDNADYYVERGDVKVQQSDRAGAIADYDHAIKLNPKIAGAFRNRSNAKSDQGDYPGAIADLDQAIKLAPDNADYYVQRGDAKIHQSDRAGALADYDHAISLNPKSAIAYFDRHQIKFSQDDYAGSIADLDQVVKFLPTEPAYYRQRGLVKDIAGDVEGAIKDYDQAIALAKDTAPNSRFFRMLAMSKLHRGEPGKEIGAVSSAWNESWQKTIGQFLAGNLPEKDLFSAADRGNEKKLNGQKCEALYFAGMMHLLKNEPIRAKDFFEKCLATKMTKYDEYTFAQAELKRLSHP
jgi:tetratricopeptide (TPR) repeat protein